MRSKSKPKIYFLLPPQRVKICNLFPPLISQDRRPAEPLPNGVHLESTNCNVKNSFKQGVEHHPRVTVFIHSLVNAKPVPLIVLLIFDVIQKSVKLGDLILCAC
mmetsp:Transcript_9915/g.12489  ORF Transcript_9915/g.12489 Transcript_9915/m.12489 type:complete len:104 (-) Transcript_9915:1146-1457(-)